jgi:hypothetical protein
MVENANAVATMAPMLAKRRRCDVGFISFSPIGVAPPHFQVRKIIDFLPSTGALFLFIPSKFFYT